MIGWVKNLVWPKWLAPVLLLVIFAGLMFKAYSFGIEVEHGRNAVTENAKIAALGEKVLALQNQKHELEQKRVKDMADLTLKFNQEIQKNEAKANAVISDVRTGALKLRIPAQVHTTACAGAATTTGNIASRGDAETSAELSQQSAEFLISQASLADQITEQLSACQAILVADRKSQLNTGLTSNTNLTGDLND